jgi:hypothetical protein
MYGIWNGNLLNDILEAIAIELNFSLFPLSKYRILLFRIYGFPKLDKDEITNYNPRQYEQ